MIGLALFLLLQLSPARERLIGADGDTCWHWRQGDWMIEHRAVLRNDPFTHTRDGGPLLQIWWLSEIAMAAVGNLMGWSGLVWLTALLCATTVWLLYLQTENETRDPLTAALFTFLAALTMSFHWLARPHLATHLLALVFTMRLRAFSQGRATARSLWWLLPPLMVLWANLHGAFVIGPVLIGTYLAGAVLENCIRWRTARAVNWQPVRTFAGLLFVCAAATVLNPYGLNLHRQVLDYLGNPLLVRAVQEYASPDFHQPGQEGFLWSLLLVLALMVWTRPRLSVTEMALILVWTWFGLHSLRNVPVFALVVTPILAAHWHEFVQESPDGSLAARWRSRARRLATLSGGQTDGWLAGAAALVMLGVVLKPVIVGGAPWLATTLPADRFPVAAVHFLRAAPDAVRGEMFNDMVWGGYLIQALPEHRVFFDGRVDEPVLRKYVEVNEVRPDWEGVLSEFKVGWTILPRDHRLNQVLQLHPGWELAYEDAVAQIYRRRAGVD